jgi:hypothetical protein
VTSTHTNIYKVQSCVFLMGKTRYKRLVEILEKFKGVECVSYEEFFKELRMNLGDDARTKKAAIELLRELNLVEELENGIKVR